MRPASQPLKFLAFALIVISVLVIEVKVPYLSELERVQRQGQITILTRNTPTTYYLGANGATGFEYDLITAFSEYIGVQANIIVNDDFSEILATIKAKDAHIAAAGITITPWRQQHVTFSDSYHDVTELLVYKAGNKKPRSVEDLNGMIVDVIDGSSHQESIRALAKKHAHVEWRSHENIDINYMFEGVSKGDFKVTIADSIDFQMNRRFYPGLKSAMHISSDKKLAWALPKTKDTSLLDAVNEFMRAAKQNGLLERLEEKHYQHLPALSFADAYTFRKHIKTHLHPLIPLFKKVARDKNLDWRFLAAMSYQESHWDPNATSPTGVRGLMMLTQATARQLGVSNRIDPYQSLDGGSTYFLNMRKRIPNRILEPDKTWLALAAYNVGLGHLEDARVITQKQGADPDRWADIREYLPLLTQKKYYHFTRYGYARGHEPVHYVRNIRNYYDLLIWEFSGDTESPDSSAQEFEQSH